MPSVFEIGIGNPKWKNKVNAFIRALEAEGTAGMGMVLNLKEETRVPANEAMQFWSDVLQLYSNGKAPSEAIQETLENEPRFYRLGTKTKPQDLLTEPLAHVMTVDDAKTFHVIPHDEIDHVGMPVRKLPKLAGPPIRKAIFATSAKAIQNLSADRVRDELGLSHFEDGDDIIIIPLPSSQKLVLRIPLAFDGYCKPPFRPPQNINLPYGMTHDFKDDSEKHPEVLIETPIDLRARQQKGKPRHVVNLVWADYIGKVTGAASDRYLDVRLGL